MTEAVASPRIFREWTAISTIAGVLQRKCWMEVGDSFIYPNLYVMLIAPPGIGKTQAINYAASFWRATEDVHVAADSLTSASLIDSLEAAGVKTISPDKQHLLTFNALTMAAGEFSVFMPGHDSAMLGTLTHIFDNPPEHRERRRGNPKPVDIPKPCLNILAGAQPAFLSELLPEYAWGQGFTARLLMIYSAQVVEWDPFAKRPRQKALQGQMQLRLGEIAKLYGGFEFTPEAVEEVQAWRAAKYAPIPTHTRLLHYIPRRLFHTLKLCMISAASRCSTRIELSDFRRARSWLLQAEMLMPDIFRDMSGKSDRAVLDDLHSAMTTLHLRDPKPISESRLILMLSNKVPADKTFRILELAERAGLIQSVGGGMYIPAPLDQVRGVE